MNALHAMIRGATLMVLILLISEEAGAARRPDIVLIMVDDMGWSDIGCFGGEISTPHLDSLAAGGLRYTEFYNTGRCCPTRAALLSGLYQHRAGIGHMTGNYGVPSYQGYLSDRCVTLAEVLRGAGYSTLMSGKWHVGSQPDRWPNHRGFDRYFGTPTGGGVYFEENLQTRKNVFFTLDEKRINLPDGWYITDLFTDHAVRFVKEAATSEIPFFLYLAHIAPHWPLQALREDIDRYRDKYRIGWDRVREARHHRQIEMGIIDRRWSLSPRPDQQLAWSGESSANREDLALRMAVYAAQVDRIDQNIGRLIDTLKEAKRFDNTLILFLSDNGGSAEGGPRGFSRGLAGKRVDEPGSYMSYGRGWANASNTPFRKYKMWTHEGGISTPLIAHWPEGIRQPGRIVRDSGHVIDIMATCLDVSAAEYPAARKGRSIHPPDGVSLRPSFEGRAMRRKRPLFWEHEGNRAVRHGRWKLVAAHKGEWELYDLTTDRTETRNRATEYPAEVRHLSLLWEEWASEVGVQPWPRVRSGKKNTGK